MLFRKRRLDDEPTRPASQPRIPPTPLVPLIFTMGIAAAEIAAVIRFARRENISLLELLAPSPKDLAEAAQRAERAATQLIRASAELAGWNGPLFPEHNDEARSTPEQKEVSHAD